MERRARRDVRVARAPPQPRQERRARRHRLGPVLPHADLRRTSSSRSSAAPAASSPTGALPETAHAWLDSLSIAGTDGTLRRRFHVSDVRGHIHGKTGTLSTVIALSGVLDIDPAAPARVLDRHQRRTPAREGLRAQGARAGRRRAVRLPREDREGPDRRAVTCSNPRRRPPRTRSRRPSRSRSSPPSPPRRARRKRAYSSCANDCASRSSTP